MTAARRLSKNERPVVHRYFTVTWADAEETNLTLKPEFDADCTLQCSFCTGFGSTLNPRHVTPELLKAIAAELDRIVSGASAPVIGLQSHDILFHPGLFELLDVIQSHGKLARVWTPGVRLADRELCRRLLDRRLDLNITFLSSNAETYTRMTGNSEAQGLLCKGLANVREVGLPVHVSVVVTAENQHDLADTLLFLRDRYAVDRLFIRLFYPREVPVLLDLLRPRRQFRLFPDYAAVNRELLRVSERAADCIRVVLFDLPLCQLEPDLLEKERLVVEDVFFNYTRVTRPVDQCQGCRAFEQSCGGVDAVHKRRQAITWLPEAERCQLLERLDRARSRHPARHEE